MDKKKLLCGVSIIILLLLIIFGCFRFSNKEDNSGFIFNNIVLKTQIIENQTLEGSLRITNLLEDRYFNVSVKTLYGVVEIQDSVFEILSGESKDIKIKFNGLRVGIYSGALVVKTNTGEKQVPVIVSVSTKDPLFFTILDEDSASKDIALGTKSNLNIKLFNIMDSTNHAVKLTYLITDLDGNILSQETETSVVGGSGTVFSKTISIPEDLKLGNYVYGVITQYGDSISTSSYLFNVVGKTSFFNKFDTNSFTILFSIVVLVFLLGIIILFVYIIYERDRLFDDLKAQHQGEFRFYNSAIEQKRKVSIAKAKTTEEKKKIAEQYRRIKEKAIQGLKKKQEAQIKHFKMLKKANKKREMQKMLSLWKKQGYDVNVFKMDTKEKKSLKSMIHDWRKQGYNLSVLEK